MVYEKDRLDPVDHTATVALDPELLGRFPEGYRHLAYEVDEGNNGITERQIEFSGPEVGYRFSF